MVKVIAVEENIDHTFSSPGGAWIVISKSYIFALGNPLLCHSSHATTLFSPRFVSEGVLNAVNRPWPILERIAEPMLEHRTIAPLLAAARTSICVADVGRRCAIRPP